MNIDLEEFGIIKKQNIVFANSMNIIYGLNNTGKTSLLKSIDEYYNQKNMRGLFTGQKEQISIFIPANRITVRPTISNEYDFRDLESFLNYKKEMYAEYDLHLKYIRDELLKYDVLKKYLCYIIQKIFSISTIDISKRASDGIENIINIYLNIIWAIAQGRNLSMFSVQQFEQMIQSRTVLVLIDEMELFLHVKVQSKLLSCLNEDFPNCKFILTTHSPLLLTRFKQLSVFQIDQGLIEEKDSELYYRDLDETFELCFEVDELPEEAQEILNYFGDIIFGEEDFEKENVEDKIRYLKNNYKNIYLKYQKLIVKVESLLLEE